jgi:hypothetical protein
MTKRNVGEISAYHPAVGPNKSYYRKIGNLFEETGRDGVARFSIKLDFIPIGNHWEGWCNVFEPGSRATPEVKVKPATPQQSIPGFNSGPATDDDIPF